MKNLKNQITVMVAVKLIVLSPILLFTSHTFAQEPFLGEIKYTGTNFCPRGTAEANGQLLPINQNQSLYSLLGTNYGGDGRTTFALPDYRSRTATGFSATNPLGSKGGSENIFLNTNNLPPHTHAATTISQVNVSSGRGRLSSPQNAVLANDGSDRIYTNAVADVNMDANAVTSVTQIGNSGNALPVNNMQPSLVIKVCIATQGVFPSRN